MKLLSTLTLATFVGFSTLFSANYKVDNIHSSIGFKVRHMMVSKTKGEFTSFNGSYSYDAKKHQLSSLEGSVSIASVNTRSAKRDAHLKTEEFFDAKRYPKMRLSMVKHSGDTVTLDLTIKGITKRLNFDIEDLSDEAKDSWGNVRTGFSISGKINRNDFKVGKDTGSMMIGADIKVSLEIEGIKG